MGLDGDREMTSTERTKRSMEEHDRDDAEAERRFLQKINPDPVKEMARSMDPKKLRK